MKNKRCILVLICLITVSVYGTHSFGADDKWFENAAGSAMELRSKAEGLTTMTKSNRKLSSAQILSANEKYDAAKAAVDGWVTQARLIIKSGDDINKSLELQNRYNELNSKAEDYVKYALQLNKLKTRGKTNIIGELLSSLPSLIKTVWEEYRKSSDERKRELLEELDTLKWRDFSAIK